MKDILTWNLIQKSFVFLVYFEEHFSFHYDDSIFGYFNDFLKAKKVRDDSNKLYYDKQKEAVVIDAVYPIKYGDGLLDIPNFRIENIKDVKKLQGTVYTGNNVYTWINSEENEVISFRRPDERFVCEEHVDFVLKRFINQLI